MAQHRFFQLVPVLACILCGAGAAPAFGAPPNDDFRDASRIDVGQTIGGTTVGATHEPGEPQHGPGTAAAVWYRFRSARRVTVLLLHEAAGVRPNLLTLDALARAGRRVAPGSGPRIGFLRLPGADLRNLEESISSLPSTGRQPTGQRTGGRAAVVLTGCPPVPSLPS